MTPAVGGDGSAAAPEFLVVGAAKSGTTALHRWLSLHPQLQLPAIKESNFFAFRGRVPEFHGPGDAEALTRSDLVASVASEEAYQRLFEPWDGRRLRGEVCPLYLYSPAAAVNIRELAPAARLIAVLRDPAERAFSQFLMMRESGREPLADFRRALAEEERRIAAGWEHAWHYRSMGHYDDQLGRYLELFPRSQIRVHLYDDLVADAATLLADLFDFLGVPPVDVGDTERRHNPSGLPRSELVDRMLRQPGLLRSALRPLLPRSWRRRLGGAVRDLNLARPFLDPELRAELIDGYRPTIARLEEMIGRDLSAWLEVRSAAGAERTG